MIAEEDWCAGLVAMDGMLLSSEWGDLGHEDRIRYLATLDGMGIRAQASVCAVELGVSVRMVLLGWCVAGYLSWLRVGEALAAQVRG